MYGGKSAGGQRASTGGIVRLCLYRHPTLTPETPRLGLLRTTDVVDVHGVCAASLRGHMRPRRAAEIADALCPPDLLSFLEGGRHAWNALRDSLDRLGPRLDVSPPTTPEGDAIVVPKGHVRLSPVVPAGAGWAGTTFGEWGTTPIPAPGSEVVVALHTDGRAYLPEYLAVVGAPVEPFDAGSAGAAVGLVVIVRPSQPQTACILLTPDEAEAEEAGVSASIAAAVLAASRNRTLLVGDVVRTGPPVMSTPAPGRHAALRIDLTEAATVDLRTADQAEHAEWGEILPA